MSLDPKDLALGALQNKLATSSITTAKGASANGKISNYSEDLAAKYKPTPQEVKAAQQFEALLLQQMFQTMWKTVPQDGMFSSKEEHYFRDMFTEGLASELSKGSGIGVKDVILQEMSKKAKTKG